MDIHDFNYPLLIIAEDNPYPTYKWMRDEDPAHYSETEDFWVLSRYEDVSAAFKNWRQWSSQRRGNLLNDIPERVGKTLGTTDPPAHTHARGLVDQAFTPRTVDDLKPKIQALAETLARAARERGDIEFVADISAACNAAILGSMFGVPDEDFIRLRHWLDDFFLREEPRDGHEAKQVVAMRHLREYLGELAARRIADPGDDLMTAMLLAEKGGKRLSEEQVVVTTMTFLTAGFESTNNLFTNLTYALGRFPELFRELKASADLIPAFVEEGMRWDAPAQGFVRSPTADIELHGKTIARGAQVLLHIGSANRDERSIDNPDEFDIHRPKQRHLGMGQGVHFCVGAALGRAMAQLIFSAMLDVATRWEVDRGQAERVRTPNFRGFSKLPLTIG